MHSSFWKKLLAAFLACCAVPIGLTAIVLLASGITGQQQKSGKPAPKEADKKKPAWQILMETGTSWSPTTLAMAAPQANLNPNPGASVPLAERG